MLPFEQLQLVITKLRFKDDSALKTFGLVKLSKIYDTYPITDGGVKLHCLIPKGMSASNASQLSKAAASEKIVVLQENGKALAKVWPSAMEAKMPEKGQETKVGPSAPKPSEPPKQDLGELEFVEE